MIKIVAIILILSGMILSCKPPGQRQLKNRMAVKSESSCKLEFIDNAFKEALYPFSFERFETKKMLGFFNHAHVDSFEMKGYNDYKYRIYKFSDANSYMEFMVKSYDSADITFYLNEGKIVSNLVKFKNGVSMGMNIGDFCKLFNTQSMNCDTIYISDGEISTDYAFIFNHLKLNKILISSQE